MCKNERKTFIYQTNIFQTAFTPYGARSCNTRWSWTVLAFSYSSFCIGLVKENKALKKQLQIATTQLNLRSSFHQQPAMGSVSLSHKHALSTSNKVSTQESVFQERGSMAENSGSRFDLRSSIQEIRTFSKKRPSRQLWAATAAQDGAINITTKASSSEMKVREQKLWHL